ncbi:Erythroid differentiation-related factor 1 [Nymphaea thermarum]|nr:Erythroid differentiation-related factor 1 [Nymphaea thermarum]
MSQSFKQRAVLILYMKHAELQLGSGQISQNLARKCEALAVSGLAEYGDEIDVIAPADILKQIFKIPYSKARLSIAVHRIGQTLVLNAGPDVEEGEKMSRRKKDKPKAMDPSLFLNFAMHSVRAEACDCPPSQFMPSEESPSPSILHGQFKPGEGSCVSSRTSTDYGNSGFLYGNAAGSQETGFDGLPDYSQGTHDNTIWGDQQNKRCDALEKASKVDENVRSPVHEPEKHRRLTNDAFLRVLFWQFQNFRMLLGSDLLLFSNEKYAAVSLHLWDVSRQITPLMWLEAWLDNVMASVPELAICYHRNGVVQGYELLKTEDVFLLKGISEDGTTTFHPQVVQQNGLSVLRFLQDNCKQDPGSYWLFKSAGEDIIQLFDLSVIPKGHASDDHDQGCSSLPTFMNKGRQDPFFSLGTLLYRLAHRLSLSKVHDNRTKCAKLFKKCLEFLDSREHLVIRAYAHEQFARLILNCHKELDLTMEPTLEYGATVTDMEDESSKLSSVASKLIIDDELQSYYVDGQLSTKESAVHHGSTSDLSQVNLEAGLTATPNSSGTESLAVCHVPATQQLFHTISDPISSKLAAIHHVSQAIKSLRWKRQLQNAEGKLDDQGREIPDVALGVHQFSICTCGDADCIEVCDIREWLPRSKMDHKLWKLVLLLGESYLALGESYKEDGQLLQTLKVVELACSVYGSMPPCLDDVQFVSSIASKAHSQVSYDDIRNEQNSSLSRTANLSKCNSCSSGPSIDQSNSKCLFWAMAWMLVGDVYVEYHRTKGMEELEQPQRPIHQPDLSMPTEVFKEVKRLKKKLGQFKQNCSMCSLMNCSCQSDRASSGNSASSSTGVATSFACGRKLSRKSQVRSPHQSSHESSENSYGSISYQSGISEGLHLQNETREVPSSNPFTSERSKASSLSSGSDFAASGQASHVQPVSFSAGHKNKTGTMNPESAGIEECGGIFAYLRGPKLGEVKHNLLAAIHCYDASREAISGVSAASQEIHSASKKKGWVCNELGRYLLDHGDLGNAELAFSDAITAFREVSDLTNIILINCNLGHGRRALAEAMVSKLDDLRKYGVLGNTYKQVVENAKSEYREALKYYCAARTELTYCKEALTSELLSLSNEVYTQYAHTYLRLGMLLAREDTTAEVYGNASITDLLVGRSSISDRKTYGKEPRTREISASDATREAISTYESLGELRAQEAAFAYFQLGSYHRDCCLKILDGITSAIKSRSKSNHLQKLKRYASLAERSWQKAIEFYGPKSHPIMYMKILLERSNLASRLSNSIHPSMMLETALMHLLEGRHVVVGESSDDVVEIESDLTMICKTFFDQLQSLLKKMLSSALAGNTIKSSDIHQGVPNRACDVRKLKEIYRMSLKPVGVAQLNEMYELWAS